MVKWRKNQCFITKKLETPAGENSNKPRNGGNKMEKLRQNQCFTSKKLETPSTIARREMGILYFLVILMGVTSIANGGHLFSNSPSALYIMGDSSVDCGENSLFYSFLHRYRSMLPCNGSVSTLLPYLLAKKMGLPNSPPFYGQNGSIDVLISGLNYGSAQATIMSPGRQSHQSLNQQLRQVRETFQLLQLQLGLEAAEHFIKSSIFYLSFGKDDYIDIFLSNYAGVMRKYSGQEFAHILVNQIIHVITSLYEANVRKMICIGILPLGCTPRIVLEWYNSTALHGRRGCVDEINELVWQYNIMLEEQIIKFNTDFTDAQIIYCDVYQGILEIIKNPARYGFDDVDSACCGLGVRGARIGCISADMACNRSSAHVWWDLYNPTQALNTLLAESAWSGSILSSICRPSTVHYLV